MPTLEQRANYVNALSALGVRVRPGLGLWQGGDMRRGVPTNWIIVCIATLVLGLIFLSPAKLTARLLLARERARLCQARRGEN